MIKVFLTILLCFSIGEGNCAELDEFAEFHVQDILKKHKLEHSVQGSTLQPGFRSLSPELLMGISKSFFILRECFPSLLEKGSYLEFGLYRGFSLWFAQQMGNTVVGNKFHYFGFDSFAGLPDSSHDYIGGAWAPGVYAASLAEVTQNLYQHGADFSNLHLVKGWISQQLFAEWEREFGNIKPAIMTIDVDVYEPCLDILRFFSVHHIQPGTIILFDDFLTKHHSPGQTLQKDINHFGERKAMIEFLSKHPDFEFTYLFPFGWHGYAFMVTACRGETLDQEIKDRVAKIVGTPELPEQRFF